MKKSLIALAALAATGAFAQSSVTLSGNLDQTYYGQGKSAAWLSNGNSTSLWSLSGTEELGGGLKGSFNLVSELNVQKGQAGSTSTGAAAADGRTVDLFNRGANVAVSGGFGTVTVGRQTDPWFSTQGSLNTSGSNSYGFGNFNAAVSNYGATGAHPLTGAVMAGVVAYPGTQTSYSGSAPFVFASGVGYTTPNFSGFQASVMSATADYNNGGVGTGTAYSLNYGNGPLKLAYASSVRNDAAGSAAWTNTVYGGSYKMGAYTFILGQNKTKFDGAASGNNNMTNTSIGLNYVFNDKVDANLAYSTLADDVNSDNKATMIGVTARYALSKRTSLYGGFGNIKNEGAAKLSAIYGAAQTGDANATTSSVMLGLKHTF